MHGLIIVHDKAFKYIAYVSCWEEIGDVLHGLRGDRGWTFKPVWEEIGDGLH